MSEEKVFSKSEQEVALAMLSAGLSRESASRSIGRASNFIEERYRSDRAFAKRVLRAEEESEQYYISRIRGASKDIRGWRAAAWMLERRLPERYGIFRPTELSERVVGAFFLNLVQILKEEIPDELLLRRILDRIKELAAVQSASIPNENITVSDIACAVVTPGHTGR